jgi:hypothetical protein
VAFEVAHGIGIAIEIGRESCTDESTVEAINSASARKDEWYG